MDMLKHHNLECDMIEIFQYIQRFYTGNIYEVVVVYEQVKIRKNGFKLDGMRNSVSPLEKQKLLGKQREWQAVKY